MKSFISLATILGVTYAQKNEKDEDQCEIRWIQAYMDEDCKQQYKDYTMTELMTSYMDSTNRMALYVQDKCAPIDRFVIPEEQQAYREITRQNGVESLYAKMSCSSESIQFNVFVDPGCTAEVRLGQDQQETLANEGFSFLPSKLDYEWGDCQYASKDIYVRVSNALGLKTAAMAATVLGLASTLY